MHIPDALLTLLDDGVIDAVERQLKSGKEADLFVVLKYGREMAAKVYKERDRRTFKNNSDYREGRQVRDSRQNRAMGKGTRFGREAQEQQWRRTEADALRRLHGAGVRVPEVHDYHEGVLIMDLVVDAQGHPAPQLGQIRLSTTEADAMWDALLEQVTRILCCDLIHGDLSPYNVLVGTAGPVIIDLPQAVTAAHNLQAPHLLERDLKALIKFLGIASPRLRPLARPAANQIWREYESGGLTPDFKPTFDIPETPVGPVDVDGVLAEIQDAREDAQRRNGSGEGGPPTKKLVVFRTPQQGRRDQGRQGGGRGQGGPPRREPAPAQAQAPAQDERPRDGAGQGPRDRGPRDQGAPRRDDRGPRDQGAPRRDDRGPRDQGAPRRDDRGPRDQGGPRRDDRGPRDQGGPRRDDRGPRDQGAPRRDDRGPRDQGAPRGPRDQGAPRRDDRGSPTGGGERRGGQERQPAHAGTGPAREQQGPPGQGGGQGGGGRRRRRGRGRRGGGGGQGGQGGGGPRPQGGPPPS